MRATWVLSDEEREAKFENVKKKRKDHNSGNPSLPVPWISITEEELKEVTKYVGILVTSTSAKSRT